MPSLERTEWWVRFIVRFMSEIPEWDSFSNTHYSCWTESWECLGSILYAISVADNEVAQDTRQLSKASNDMSNRAHFYNSTHLNNWHDNITLTLNEDEKTMIFTFIKHGSVLETSLMEPQESGRGKKQPFSFFCNVERLTTNLYDIVIANYQTQFSHSNDIEKRRLPPSCFHLNDKSTVSVARKVHNAFSLSTH